MGTLIKMSDYLQNTPKKLFFYRQGDFYESYFKHAKIAALILQLPLSTIKNVPTCMFPVYRTAECTQNLNQAGYKIAFRTQTQPWR